MTTSPFRVHRLRAVPSASTTLARPHLRRARWAAIGVCAGAAALLLSLAAHRVPYFATDLSITRTVQAADLGILAAPLGALNRLGFPPLVDLVYGGIIVILFRSGRRWEAAACGFAAAGGAALNAVVKHLVDRPRPSGALVHVEHLIGNPSFPAGHVVNLTAFAGFLCCLLALRMAPSARRTAMIGGLVALIALMGLARVASGEHWASDVLGGYLLGILWLAVTLEFYEWGYRRRRAARPRLIFPGLHRVIAPVLLCLTLPLWSGPAHAADDDADSLRTSTGVPWNPPEAMARRRGWEQGVLLPGRILSLPLVGVGYLSDHALFAIEQDPRFANGLAATVGPRARSIVLKTAWLGDRAGLEGGIEVRHALSGGPLKSVASIEYDGTLNRYNRTLVTVTGRPLSLQYGYDWRPGERFYGLGNTTPVTDISDYATQSEYLRAGLGWGSDRTFDPAHPHSMLRLWGGPRSAITSPGRERGQVSYETRFPTLAATTLDQRVENLVYGIAAQVDRRTGSPHWSHGWRTSASAERFDRPVHGLALHSGTADGVPFTRLQAETEAGVSFMRDSRTLRWLVHVTDLQAGSDRDHLLPSDLTSLGGRAGLGGFDPGRFHDMDMLLTRLTYVFPLVRRLEMDLHAEWGAVYPDIWSDAKFNTLHDSFGFALRARDDRVPHGSIGFDFSREAVRLRFSLGGVE